MLLRKIKPSIALLRVTIAMLILGAIALTTISPWLPDPALAQTRDPGIGGTGERPDEENGIGGTGDRAEPGIGGTGVIGVITGYGSIFVNGLEIDTDRANITDDLDRTLTKDDLEIGQVVEVSTDGDGKKLTARAVKLRHEVSGPIQSIDRERHTLVVLGQSVEFESERDGAQAEDMSSLSEGDNVAVSGFRRSDGTVAATRIKSVDADRPHIVRGPIESIGEDGFAIGGLRVRSPQAERPEGLEAGSSVLIVDPSRDGTQHRQRISIVPRYPLGGRYRRLSIEGYVARSSGEGLRIGATVLDRGSDRNGLDIGRRVIVEGQSNADGRFVARSTVRSQNMDRGAVRRPRGKDPEGRPGDRLRDRQQFRERGDNRVRDRGKSGQGQDRREFRDDRRDSQFERRNFRDGGRRDGRFERREFRKGDGARPFGRRFIGQWRRMPNGHFHRRFRR